MSSDLPFDRLDWSSHRSQTAAQLVSTARTGALSLSQLIRRGLTSQRQDEDDFAEAISQIIKRDFFPELYERDKEEALAAKLATGDIATPGWTLPSTNRHSIITPTPYRKGIGAFHDLLSYDVTHVLAQPLRPARRLMLEKVTSKRRAHLEA